MTMQLAFEHVSPEASRLSFQERSRRMGNMGLARCAAALPHVDDLLFAIALAGLLALGGVELREGVDYALATQPTATAVTAVAPSRVPG
jgi:hypothetical protein